MPEIYNFFREHLYWMNLKTLEGKSGCTEDISKDRIFIIMNWVSPKFFLSYFVFDWVEVRTNQNEDAKSKQMSKLKQMSTINKSWLLLFVLNLNICFKIQKCIFDSICDRSTIILFTSSRNFPHVHYLVHEWLNIFTYDVH